MADYHVTGNVIYNIYFIGIKCNIIHSHTINININCREKTIYSQKRSMKCTYYTCNMKNICNIKIIYYFVLNKKA